MVKNVRWVDVFEMAGCHRLEVEIPSGCLQRAAGSKSKVDLICAKLSALLSQCMFWNEQIKIVI